MVQGLIYPFVRSGFSMFLLLVGLYVMHLGRQQRTRSGRIEETETTDIRDMQPGTVEITGTAKPVAESTTLRSPITELDSLAAHINVQVFRGAKEGNNWKSFHNESKSVPMVVDDGTGEVRVEVPADGDVNLEPSKTKLDRGEKPPEPVRQYIETEADVDEKTRDELRSLSRTRRRYAVGVVEPGEEVYVFGRAREQADWDGPEYVIDEPTASGEFILSDKSETQVIQEENNRATSLLIAGGFLTFLSVVYMGFSLLPILFG